MERYLHKGIKIVLSGRIQNDNYTNKEGQMVYSVRVMVDEIEFAESKSASGGNSAMEESSSRDGFMNIPDGLDEELPFN